MRLEAPFGMRGKSGCKRVGTRFIRGYRCWIGSRWNRRFEGTAFRVWVDGRETRISISDCASVALRPPRLAAISKQFYPAEVAR